MYYINMNSRNYVFIFITGLILLAISIAPYSSVQASQIVFDEIEKYVSPTEEKQID